MKKLIFQDLTPLSSLFLILITAVLAGCMGYAPGRQSYWDAQVKEMCEKDGGVTIYEHIDISEDEYKKLGGTRGVVPVPDERSSNKKSPYFARLFTQEINSSNPRVIRQATEIVRRSDKKILGKVVSYSRIGGDIPTGIGHDTYFSCQDIPGIRLDVEKQIFVIRGAVK